eukprot:CAMPEP_0204592928 /NCGR_PEP_ID=MMETSP0661-20131031/51217_1 /ASSEMBLY_ACC=CAM_ASM_000606 /TAXON_ID=109239 /ORGANISM="Alexandrium margalefi, Strain AMGDE01CS-322" /LENGTH=260 /DNA_ID=CAMNT_0051603185 /DNA_START=60 /DNA_END=842 /DNA_ORIENTATION=-
MATGGMLDASIQAKLLDNPQVKEAMKNAGSEALQSKEVQDAVIKAAKETLTAENAKLVADKAREWANDPEVQAKARHYSGMAMEKMGQAGQLFIGCIEQGPAGVRVLAFLTGVASCIYACVWVLHNLKNIKLVMVGITLFQIFFAVTTMLFEASPEQIAKAAVFSEYQNYLMEYAKFLTVCRGRGFFYIFQALMWLTLFDIKSVLTDPWQLVTLGIGGVELLMGVLHVLMHYGIMPQTVAAKAKEVAGNAYHRVSGAAKP